MESTKSKILFVDDEQHLLDGLKRSLRGQRGVWDMSFACSGEEALQMADEIQFDVIVSDMRMPGMSGAELLEQLSERHPEMVRIILSGHSDEAMILKAVPVAHQFLSKPCDVEVIKQVITRSIKIRSLIADPKVQRLVSQIRTLPTLPSLYVELTQLLNSESANVERVGEVIGREPVMTSKILQMVNSAFFGVGREVTSPVQAASLLGIETIRGLVLTVGIFMQFDDSSLSNGGFSLSDLHRHSLSVSQLSKRIAQSLDMTQAQVDECMLAGLLHDIGKLVLVQCMPQEYQEFYDRQAKCDTGIVEAELAAFNAEHGQVGAYLLGLWALPQALVEAVAFHHKPLAAGQSDISPLLVVHVADALISADSDNCAVIPVEVDREYLDACGVSDRLEQWQSIKDELSLEVLV